MAELTHLDAVVRNRLLGRRAHDLSLPAAPSAATSREWVPVSTNPSRVANRTINLTALLTGGNAPKAIGCQQHDAPVLPAGLKSLLAQQLPEKLAFIGGNPLLEEDTPLTAIREDRAREVTAAVTVFLRDPKLNE
jgi:hypothetical protein